MKERGRGRRNLAGQLLLAHPALKDPNFRRTVVLMSAHNKDGSLGVVLNRPMGQTLAEYNRDFTFGPLAQVPVYRGGPVAEDQLIFAAWRWIATDGAFQLQFGLEPDKAGDMAGQKDYTLRAFLGYAGWSAGQLENEMKHNTWFVAPVDTDVIGANDGVALWRVVLGSLDPELRLLAGEPEDPAVN